MRGSGGEKAAFLTETPWQEVRPIRECLHTFSTQTVTVEMAREAKEAVKPWPPGEDSLHVKVHHRGETHYVTKWAAIGVTTVSKTMAIIKKHQPLTWSVLYKVVCQPGAENKTNSPVNIVSLAIIST
jgi:hypothetical protein